MKIIRGINNLQESFPAPVVAIGVFDGVHRGHQRLLTLTREKARDLDGTSLVITFDPHPVHVLHPDKRLPLIVSLDKRLELIESLGIQACLVLRFTKTFARQEPEEFVRRYLMSKIQPRVVVVGDDFRFGRDRRGTIEIFNRLGERHGFDVATLKADRGGEKYFSSSRIRHWITEGNLTKVKQILGRDYSVEGRVIRGDGRGRRLGFPTANIRPQGKLLPPGGVYWVGIRMNGQLWPGMANIGSRPSVSQSGQIVLEVHLFDRDPDLYQKNIEVIFFKRVRDERAFPTTQELVGQLNRDRQAARRWFDRHPIS